jgi:hypothetical protein
VSDRRLTPTAEWRVLERLAAATEPLSGMYWTLAEQAILGALRASGFATHDGSGWVITKPGANRIRDGNPWSQVMR